MWSISLLGRIDDNVKVTLVQPVAPAVGFAPPDAEPGQRREKKKILCRSSSLLAAGGQIKET